MYGDKLNASVLLLFVFALCLTAGCGQGKMTQVNADKIKEAMSEEEVLGILGPPSESRQVELPDLLDILGSRKSEAKKGKQSVWKNGGNVIKVTFVDGKVIRCSFSGL